MSSFVWVADVFIQKLNFYVFLNKDLVWCEGDLIKGYEVPGGLKICQRTNKQVNK